MGTASLYDRPDLYDLIAPRDQVSEAFYLGVAAERGGRVLELACGSGRLTVPLAAAGFDVLGADLSPQMLGRARAAAKARGVAAEFVEADMRGFDFGRQFDTIIVGMNSILHLHTAEDFAGFFSSVRRHLAPGGRLAFDAFVPSVGLLSSDPNERQLMAELEHETLGRVTVEETIRYEPISQISHVEWFWSTATERDFWRMPLALRQIFPQEMPLLLAAGGMRLVERFGDFERGALTAASRHQVCICAV